MNGSCEILISGPREAPALGIVDYISFVVLDLRAMASIRNCIDAGSGHMDIF